MPKRLRRLRRVGSSGPPPGFYVATTGNNANDGSFANPWRTIEYGMTHMSAGDTLYIRAGTYAEDINANLFTFPIGTSWANAPRIVAYPGSAPYESVTVTGSIGPVETASNPEITYLWFEGFAVQSAVGFYGHVHHIRLWYLDISGGSLSAITTSFPGAPELGATTRYSQYIHVKGCNIHDAPGHGLYIASSDNTVENCIIYNNGGLPTGNPHFGFQVYNGDGGFPDNNTIKNCLIYGHTDHANAGAGVLGSGDNNVAYNLIGYGNNSGMQLGYDATNPKLYNCTFYGTVTDGIQIRSNTSSAIVRNNIVWGTSGTGVDDLGSTSPTMSHNLSNLTPLDGTSNQTGDPQFVNAAGQDFHIQASGAADENGTTVALVTTDYDGNSRPQGVNYDIGAYELV